MCPDAPYFILLVEKRSAGTTLRVKVAMLPMSLEADLHYTDNFYLKLSHAASLQLELYCVNQAHNSPTIM
jgi:hypothetical protein